MPACQITFSPTKPAAISIPEYGIVAGQRYWASDQALPDASGNPVHLMGHLFLQPEDVDDGARPPRFAGNLYLKWLNCVLQDGNVGDCAPVGACVVDNTCCYMTFSEDMCTGAWQGFGSECVLPECDGIICCDMWGGDCVHTTRNMCLLANGWPLEDEENCVGPPEPCIGACCFYDGEVGLGCIDGYSPRQCRDLPNEPGGGNIAFTRWQGPGSTCAENDCPEEGACCSPGLAGIFNCRITTAEQCLDEGSFERPGTFMGLGTSCNDEGVCGGACCQFTEPGDFGGGGCFDVDLPGVECIGTNRQFLGPGTSCADNAGDCGLCCLVDPSTGEIVCDENLLQDECLAAGGTPFGPEATCAICDNVRRACCLVPGLDDHDPFFPCDTGAWECRDVRSKKDCIDMGGWFRFDRHCGQFPCLLPGGACCCPAGSCPRPPCEDASEECTCFDTLPQDCPDECVWYGPGRGCRSGSGETPVPPPIPAPCLVDCNIVGCIPDP